MHSSSTDIAIKSLYALCLMGILSALDGLQRTNVTAVGLFSYHDITNVTGLHKAETYAVLYRQWLITGMVLLQ